MINGIVCRYLDQIKVYDFETYLHCRRVARISISIGQELSLEPSVLKTLYYSALLHDLGKVNIPRKILNCTYKLSDHEWKIIRQHPIAGAGILQTDNIPEDIIAGIRTHHERWNGKGYPYGLAGENIPLAGRIIAVADALDAMTSARPYRRRPLSADEAIGEIQSLSGRQFDPYIACSLGDYIFQQEAVHFPKGTFCNLQEGFKSSP